MGEWLLLWYSEHRYEVCCMRIGQGPAPSIACSALHLLSPRDPGAPGREWDCSPVLGRNKLQLCTTSRLG